MVKPLVYGRFESQSSWAAQLLDRAAGGWRSNVSPAFEPHSVQACNDGIARSDANVIVVRSGKRIRPGGTVSMILPFWASRAITCESVKAGRANANAVGRALCPTPRWLLTALSEYCHRRERRAKQGVLDRTMRCPAHCLEVHPLLKPSVDDRRHHER